MSRENPRPDPTPPHSVVTPGDLSPARELSLLEEISPRMAPMLRELRDQWIRQFDVQTAPEMLILDQALVAYAYSLMIGQEAAVAMRRSSRPSDGPAPGDGPPPRAGGGGKKAERKLRLLVRLNRMFLRNLNALKRWKTQDIGTAMMESVLGKLRRGGRP